MELKKLVELLEKRIEVKLDQFIKHAVSYEAYTSQAENEHQKMYDIMVELRPVEALVRQKNPTLNTVFDTLQKTFDKDNFHG